MELITDSGLNTWFDPEALHISFVDSPAGKFRRPEYATRSFEALAPILEDPDSIKGMEQSIIYWMFRNSGHLGDEHMVSQYALRYDMSVFRQRQFGMELMKTSGHYHPDMWLGGPSYPELYEVPYGTAIFLMQEVDDIYAGPDKVQVKNCIALVCEQGQKAIMPPNFGHVTLNPNPKKALITTNWVCSSFASVYGGAEICRGFSWFRTEDRGWIENPHYQCEIPRLRFARCADVPELGLIRHQGIYPVGVKNPELMAFVTRPQDYVDLMWQGIVFDDPADEAWKAEYVASFKEKFGRGQATN
jgi:glucose-6-phosphate isomerase